MYEQFFGLKLRPFKIAPDPDFIFWTKAHRNAATVLAIGIEQLAPITVMTGEVGTGKTTLVRQFLEEVPRDLNVGLISNFWSERGDLYRWLLTAFDIRMSGTEIELFRIFETFVISEYGQGRRCVLIVDEAQNISDADLEQLRMLTNINSNKDSLLMLVLVGQPQLRDRLRQGNNRQIAQRVGTTFHLPPMSMDETRDYVRHRIAVAGGEREIFDDAALDQIHHLACGIPRLVNVVAELALVVAFGDGTDHIDGRYLSQFVEEARSSGMLTHVLGGPPAEVEPRHEVRPTTAPASRASSGPGPNGPASGAVRLVARSSRQARAEPMPLARPAAPFLTPVPARGFHEPKLDYAHEWDPAPGPAPDPGPSPADDSAVDPDDGSEELAAQARFAERTGLGAARPARPPADAGGTPSGGHDTLAASRHSAHRVEVADQGRAVRSRLVGAAAFAAAAALVGGLAILAWPAAREVLTAPQAAVTGTGTQVAAPASTGSAIAPDPAAGGALDNPDTETLMERALATGASDSRETVINFSRAALRGNARSATYLGHIFEAGDGVPRDRALARSWYLSAAGKVASADRRLGDLAPPERGGPMGAPDLLLGGPTAEGGAEFVWTSGEGVDPGYFLIELAAGLDGPVTRYPPQEVSAVQLDALGDAAIWRVFAVDPEAGRYSVSEWHPIGAAPDPAGLGRTPVSPDVTIYADAEADVSGLETILSDLTLRDVSRAAATTGLAGQERRIRYFFEDDHALADEIAASIPDAVTILGDPLEMPETPAQPGKLDVLLGGGPAG